MPHYYLYILYLIWAQRLWYKEEPVDTGAHRVSASMPNSITASAVCG